MCRSSFDDGAMKSDNKRLAMFSALGTANPSPCRTIPELMVDAISVVFMYQDWRSSR